MRKSLKRMLSFALTLILIFSAIPVSDNFGFFVEANAIEIPSYYSTKDLYELSQVKDQNPYGTCWAFATVAAAETNLIVKGLVDSDVDLSELHLAKYMYNDSVVDPLGNFTGDKVQLPADTDKTYLDFGGATSFIGHLLFRWTGLADEETMMYEDARYSLEREYPDEYGNGSDAYRIKNIYSISNTTENESKIKSMIMEHGHAYVSVSTDTKGFSKHPYKAYYQNKTEYTDHAVVFVGWDDNYSKENFTGSYKPENDGAWLVRNSWGSNIHDKGYYWVSYEELSIQDSLFYFYEFDTADLYDYNYQYDGGVASATISFDSPVYFANVFEAKHNEYLKAVAIENSSYIDFSESYEIDVYRNLPDPNDPTSGERVESAYTIFECEDRGFYTVDLKNSVRLSDGELFSIVVKSNKISYDSRFSDISQPSVSEGQSFYKVGDTWNDVAVARKYGNFRIKAFTSTDNLEIPKKFKAKLNDDFVSLSWKSVENAVEYNVFRSVNDEPFEFLTTTEDVNYIDDVSDAGGAKIRYKVRAVNELKDVSDYSVVKTVRLPVEIKVNSVDIDDMILHVNNTATMNCVILPLDATDNQIAFSSTNKDVAVIDDEGNIITVGSGETTINVVSRDGGKRDSAKLTVLEHTYVSEIIKDPTHIEEGEVVNICECGYTCTEPVAKLEGHSYTSEITAQPTHITEGIKTFICECGDTYTESVPKTEGHTYSTVITAPTCTVKGYTTYICACGDSYNTDYKDTVPHEYTSEITVQPTHISEGVETFSCECGDSYTEYVAKLEGHTYTSEITTQPTHITEGIKTFTCECGDNYTESVAKLEGHIYTSEITTQATHLMEGVETFTCICGDTYTKSVAKIKEHTYKSEITVPATHTAYGTETFTCECGESYTKSIAKLTGHTYTESVTEPTCTDRGFTMYTCECGASYKNNYVNASGHTFAQWEETKAPTCTKKGEAQSFCVTCGITKTKDIALLPHEYSSL